MCSSILMVSGIFIFINRHFSGFAFIWFENHSNKVAEQLSREFPIYLGEASNIKGVLSSAQLAKSISSKIVNRSHMKKSKSKGPNMEPFGTPNKIPS